MFARTRVAGFVLFISTIFLAAGCQGPPSAQPNGGIHAPQRKAVMTNRQLAMDIQEETGPIHASTYVAAGRLHESQGRLLPAIQQYQYAAQEDPRNVEVLARIGLLNDRLGNSAAAEAAYKQALAIAPDDARLHNNLAFSYIMRKKWHQAETELNAALKLAPDFARARVNLAMTLAQMDRFDEAFDQFKKVLPLADTHYNMGLMYQSKRKTAEAAMEYKKALQADSKLVAAEEQLKRMPSAVVSEADHRLKIESEDTALAEAPAAPVQVPDDEAAKQSDDVRELMSTAINPSTLKLDVVPLVIEDKMLGEKVVRSATIEPAILPGKDSRLPSLGCSAMELSDFLQDKYFNMDETKGLQSLLQPWQHSTEAVAGLPMSQAWLDSVNISYRWEPAYSPLPLIRQQAAKTEDRIELEESNSPQ